MTILPAEPHMLDVLQGFVHELRIAGLPVSMTENLDAMRAVEFVALDEREAFKAALGATLVKNAGHYRVFDTVFEVFFSMFSPGVNADGAAWLADRGALATGADCLMYEAFDPRQNILPVHSLLLQGRGIALIENLDLEGLAAAAIDRPFTVVVLPLKLVGATGSQVRPIAIA